MSDTTAPNSRIWSLVGALFSSAYLLTIYALPLWGMTDRWDARFGSGTFEPEPAALAAHVVMLLAYGAVGLTGLMLVWMRRPRRIWVVTVRTVVAVVAVAAAVIVGRSGMPPFEHWSISYGMWNLFAALTATFAALFTGAQWFVDRRATREIGPRALT